MKDKVKGVLRAETYIIYKLLLEQKYSDYLNEFVSMFHCEEINKNVHISLLLLKQFNGF